MERIFPFMTALEILLEKEHLEEMITIRVLIIETEPRVIKAAEVVHKVIKLIMNLFLTLMGNNKKYGNRTIEV